MSGKVKSTLKVGVSGVRGIVGESLTPSIATDFAAAFGEYVGRGRVVVGRDTRNTGPMLENAVIAGLLSVGCQPVMIGVVPTPTVQIMVDKLRARGGIAITASHNPVEWNAMKFIGASGVFLDYAEANELLDVYNQPDTAYVAESDYRSLKHIDTAFEEHERRIFAHVDVDLIRQAGFSVAVDCCNGVGALYSRGFLENLGCSVFTLFDEPDGRFRRGPEPTPENLRDLRAAVVDNGCAIGFAQDPDGDRIALVDEHGDSLGEQYSVVLAARHVLAKTPGPVVANVQTTKALADVATAHNCEMVYSKVGEINVTGEMLRRGAVVGGEGGSGGVIWPRVHPCRDSFAAMALMLEMLAEEQCPLSDIKASVPSYAIANRKVACSAADAQEIIRRLRTKFAALNPSVIDGLRIEWDDSWVLIRPSNTEPVVRISAEAETVDKADQLAAEFADKVTDGF